MDNSYGPHLTIDSYDCDRKKLADFDLVHKVLNELPEKIGMKKLTHPYVLKHTDCPKEEWGITGFVIIAESHVSIHTYPEKGFMVMDVFSCKPFDTRKAIEFVKQAFNAKRMDINVVKRGIDFSKAEKQLLARTQTAIKK